MKSKVLIILFLFCAIFFFFFIPLKESSPEKKETFYIYNLEDESIESLVIRNFEKNEQLTVGQSIIFFNRYLGNNVSNYEEAKEFCVSKNVFLPSDLIYDSDDWEMLWRDIVLGNTVFEQVNENTYSITLIQGYLKIYLNQQGYDLIKKGLIPPHLYFYSPFSSIKDLEEVNLNKNATLGFALETLMAIIYNDENRKEVLHDLIANQVESLTNIDEKDWTSTEIAIYNYYSLSYYGEFSYFKSQGYLENIELDDLTSEISVNEFLILIEKILK